MLALCNRADHYIFIMFLLLLLSSSFFPRLISAVGDWMFTILWHMVWPECEFRMQVLNVLHAARWKYRTQLECGPMPNVMATLPNIGGALCSTPQSLTDAQYWSAVQ